MEKEETIFEYKLISGFRKNSQLLLIENEEQIFKFKSHKKKENVKYYYCYEKNCNVAVAVEFNSTRYCRKITKNQTHNHGSQIELIKKFEIMNNIKSEVKKAPLKRASVRDIFDEQCKKFKEGAQYVEYGSMRRQLFNIKQEDLPKCPMSFADIITIFQNENVYQQFGISRYEENDKPFYIDTVISQNFSYTLFASPTIINGIRSMSILEPRTFIVDGTFNIVPVSKNFKQLLTLHIVHAEHVSNNIENNSTYLLL